MALLSARALPPVLSAINTDGIKLTMLMTTKGSLLGCAGETIFDTTGKEVTRKAIAAIVSNIWSDFCDNDVQSLEFLSMTMDLGTVLLGKVCNDFLVCCVARSNIPDGLVKLKLKKLCCHLEGELSKLKLDS
eukprot:g3404.t1